MSPAVSRNQKIAMNLAHAVQTGQATAKPGSPSAQIAKSMKPSDVNEFASTPQAGLPKRVKPKPVKKAKKARNRKPPKSPMLGGKMKMKRV